MVPDRASPCGKLLRVIAGLREFTVIEEALNLPFALEPQIFRLQIVGRPSRRRRLTEGRHVHILKGRKI
jgi:hypothetical protein